MNDLKPKSKREHTEKQEFRRFMNICWGKFESLFVSGMVTVSKMDFPAAMRLKIYSLRVLNIEFFFFISVNAENVILLFFIITQCYC